MGNPEGTGALEASDKAAAEVQKGERVTLDSLKVKVAEVHYVRFGLLTVAVLELRNGFMLVGESACADPANFNQALGCKLAYEHGLNKLWALEGYKLRDKLHAASVEGGGVGTAPITAEYLGWAAGESPLNVAKRDPAPPIPAEGA